MLLALPPTELDLLPGSHLRLQRVSWLDYEKFLAANPSCSQRSSYFQGTLEIVAPLPEHERPNRLIADIVKEILDFQGRDWDDFGSTTFRLQAKGAGVDPDSSFYIDERAATVASCRRIDLSELPPPDLVIESDVTSQTAPAAYEALAIPEIWIYRSGTLQIYQYQAGRYETARQSALFPKLDVAALVEGLGAQLLAGVPASRLRQQVRQHLGSTAG